MYSINTFTKKKYITPVIEFEMMEEGGALMETQGSMPNEEAGGGGTGGDKDPEGFAKQSDFIFDECLVMASDELSR